MSRILKALDQLEQAKSIGGPGSGVTQNSTLPATRPVSRRRKQRYVKFGLVWVLVATVASIGVLLFWFYSHDRTATSDLVQQKLPSVEPRPLAAQMSTDIIVQRQIEPITAAAIDSSEPALPPLSHKPSDGQSVRPAPPKPITTHPSVTPQARVSAVTRTITHKVRLQAIAWSPVANDRMAVINDEIVREGDSMEGLSIVSINVDDVVFNDRGDMVKAILGRSN